MPRPKNPNNNYFNQQVEDAVCAYLSTDNQIEREKHFKIIYPALCKIAEVWYNKLRFSQSDDTMEDDMAGCVAWLVEKMDKFKCGKGTKAFSYYTVTAKFYYMQLSNKNYKYFKNNLAISELGENWDIENTEKQDLVNTETAKFLDDFIQYCYHNIDKMFTPILQTYAKAVLDVMSNFEQIEDFRPRKVLQFIYKVGNVSEVKKTYINKVITIMSVHMTLYKKRWNSGDTSLELCRRKSLTASEKKLIRETIVAGKRNNGTSRLAIQFGVDVKTINDYLKTI